MKRINTEHLLTLGMALTSDKRSMERRVRGVFARRKSAKGVLALSFILALTLGFAAFTTACQPGQAISSGGNALSSGGNALASGGNALTSGGNALTSGGNALASGGNAVTSGGNAAASGDMAVDDGFTKAEAMQVLTDELARSRKMIVPHMESTDFNQRGKWEIKQKPDAKQLEKAANSFLNIANAIFDQKYQPDEMNATYYIDNSGFRSDVWRFDSKDGVLSGALNGKTLAFLSADCTNEPADAMHPTITDDGELDVTAITKRIAKLLDGTAGTIEWRSGYSRPGATNGWMNKRDLLFPLGDGRYCAISVFGDAKLTPTTVCVYPDLDCGNENAFWRADLDWTEGVTSMLHPQDFKKGEPGPDDMKQETAIAFFQKLIETAGLSDQAVSIAQPKATFMVDHSGTRENYWLIEAGGITLELTSKTGRMLSLAADSKIGGKLGLGEISYENMGGKEYADATEKLFVALFGKDAIKEIQENAVYDYHYCTMDPIMADGTQYEIMYNDGMIVEVASFYKIDPNTWPSMPEWLKEYASVDKATGEITIPGFENGTWKIIPNWIADWVYINNETGEIYAKEW